MRAINPSYGYLSFVKLFLLLVTGMHFSWPAVQNISAIQTLKYCTKFLYEYQSSLYLLFTSCHNDISDTWFHELVIMSRKLLKSHKSSLFGNKMVHRIENEVMRIFSHPQQWLYMSLNKYTYPWNSMYHMTHDGSNFIFYIYWTFSRLYKQIITVGCYLVVFVLDMVEYNRSPSSAWCYLYQWHTRVTWDQ